MVLADPARSYRPAGSPISANRLGAWAEAETGNPSSLPYQPYPQSASPLLECAFTTFQADISRLTFKSMAIVSTLHRHGNSIPFAALR